MNKPTIITTPSGDRMAVLPLDDYERLIESLEDYDDVRAYDEVKSQIAAGQVNLIPAAMVDRLLDGESKIRVWREHRGLTATALAEAAGISAAFLSQIEGGTREGSFDTMKRIAEALKISLDDLA